MPVSLNNDGTIHNEILIYQPCAEKVFDAERHGFMLQPQKQFRVYITRKLSGEPDKPGPSRLNG
ncbi:MAG: hypothetical protein AUJ57_11290 [Zetaproteobacteria bacterium CG1_02_53_45]|nr:MAG: hypothetical protein AUJ57_11290 [Zetaproteobacteria bacterium CG1_02_53_45]